ncbi:MAG: hypothetical protein ACI9IJ_001485 [Psychromonas sp.]|jgi:hypothetical protein
MLFTEFFIPSGDCLDALQLKIDSTQTARRVILRHSTTNLAGYRADSMLWYDPQKLFNKLLTFITEL